MKIKSLLDLYLHELQVQNDIDQPDQNNASIFDMNDTIDNLSNTYNSSGGGFSTTNMADHISEDEEYSDGTFDNTCTPNPPPDSITEDNIEHIFNNDAINSPSSEDKSFTPSLAESKHSSRNFTSVNTKIKRATGQLASIEARKHNDSDYKQMIYHREKFEYYRDKVHDKYGSRVRSRARQ